MENKNYQYELLQRLSFTRFGGTEKELEAAKILLGEIESFGGKGEIMDFEIPAAEFGTFSIAVTAPFQRDIPCVPYGMSGNLPEGGVDLKLRYVEVNSPAGFYGLGKDLSDTAVLVNSPMNFDFYKELAGRKAAAIIVIAMDKWYDKNTVKEMRSMALRETMLAVAKIPTFAIMSKDAMALVQDGAEAVHLELRQKETTHTSRDVVATVSGTEIEGEDIVLTAHFDSVTVGTGSWDNASGSVNLMYIYEHFLHNPPKRTMHFVWCGSEEQGLYGSKAFIAQHEELLPSIRFCFNFDMCGTILGSNMIFVTGGKDLEAISQQIADEYGYPISPIHSGVHSSDSAPFADKGIPSVGLGRGTRTAEIHTPDDLMPPMSAEKLVENGDFAIFFIDRFVNSAVFPVKREIPEDMVKKVEEYFGKDKLKALEEERKKEAEKKD